jgi:hypothetical protein
MEGPNGSPGCSLARVLHQPVPVVYTETSPRINRRGLIVDIIAVTIAALFRSPAADI